MQIKLPGENRNQAFSLISFFLTQKKCKIRQFARFIGTLVSICPAVKYGRLYFETFERQTMLGLQANNQNYNKIITVPKELRPDLL